MKIVRVYLSVQKYLEQYQVIQDRIVYYRNKMRGIKAITYDSVPGAPSSKENLTFYIAKIEELEFQAMEIEEFVLDNLDGDELNVVLNTYFGQQMNVYCSRSTKWRKLKIALAKLNKAYFSKNETN